MLHRILEIAEEGMSVSLFRGFLRVLKTKEVILEVPIDDIAVLLVTAQGCVLTKNVLMGCVSRGAVVVFCGATYKPESIMIPLFGSYEFSGRMDDQIASSIPLVKQIWRTIVKEKIHNQAEVLEIFGSTKTKDLRILEKSVLSGDSNNREAVAAAVYWKALFGKDFRRDQDGDGVNSALNYGYAILRGIMARAVCSVGLHPSLGIHHINRLNNYCLVDDLIEPYRPLVDMIVYGLIDGEDIVLDSNLKKEIVRIAWMDLLVEGQRSPLVKAVEDYSFSLVRSYKSKMNLICIPKLILEDLVRVDSPSLI